MKKNKKSASQASTPYSPYHLSFDEFAGSTSMPAQWDLTELMAAPRPSRNGQGAQPAQSVQSGAALPEQPASEQGEPGGMASHWQRNFFPEPRTFPVDWDLSR